MSSGDSYSPQAASPIDSAFGGLRTELDELDKRLNVLFGKLDPVLSPSSPEVCGSDSDKDECVAADITVRVRNITSEIQARIISINTVISRLEV